MINIKKLAPVRLRRKIKLNLYKGNKYTCPFCNYSSRNLAPIVFNNQVLIDKQVIGAGRRNGGCHNCGSSDRERLIYVFLKERENSTFFTSENSILHIAPASILSKKLLEFKFGRYVCGDLYAEGYNYPDHVENINILNIPYPDNSFDYIICNHVLEHIEDDVKAIKEIYRVLKEGGKAILQVPISPNLSVTFEDFSIKSPKEKEVVFGQYDHVRIYGQDYVSRLQKNGFQVDRINISNEFTKYGLNPLEDIFLCKK